MACAVYLSEFNSERKLQCMWTRNPLMFNTWRLLYVFARNARRSTASVHVRPWYIHECRLLWNVTSPQVSALYPSFVPKVVILLRQHTPVSDLIHSGFFVLRIYALWNNNKIVLAVMLSTSLVSLMLSTHPRLVTMHSAGSHHSIR